MKALSSYITIVVVCGLAFWSCKQITKSVKDTFIPKPTPPVVSKPALVRQAIDSTTGQAIMQMQQQLSTALIKVHTAAHRIKPAAVKRVSFLTNTTALQKAEASLRNFPQYRGKEMFIYESVHFYDDGSIHIMLRHPENPDYVDSYEYQNGAWSKPKPVRLSVNVDIAGRSVSLNEVNFTSIANITRIYNQKAAQIEGARPTTNAYMIVWDKAMRWYPCSINGSRQQYSIQYNNDGTLKDFRQN